MNAALDLSTLDLSDWLSNVQQALASRATWVQLAFVTVALAVAWLLARPASARAQAEAHAGDIARARAFAAKSFARVAFPLAATALLVAGAFTLARFQNARIVVIAATLAATLAAIRFAVYALRKALPPSAMLKAFERAIAYTVWIGVALYLLGLLPEIRRTLEEIVFPIGKTKTSLLDIVQALFTVIVALILALWVSGIIERRLTAGTTLDSSLAAAITKFIRVLAITLAVLIALPAAGVDLTALSVFGGALGVGLGFGLQKIAANYVSGFIILLERSIHLGDMVTVDKTTGIVNAINARYTLIRSLDGTETIIPNETLMGSAVVNQTHTDRRVLITLPVSVAYGSNLDSVISILEGAARAQPRVLSEPGPAAVVRNLGDSAIELDLLLWIADPEQGRAALRSDIYREIVRQFTQQGVEIPFPRREVSVISMPTAVPSRDMT